MTQRTSKFKLPYLSQVGEVVTPEMERIRYTTIDTQMQSIFAALGDGVITGWQVSTSGSGSFIAGSVWISAGRGHIGNMAGETASPRRLSGLSVGSTYYIHATLNERTPINKDVTLFASETLFNDSSTILLAKITINSADSDGYVIDNTARTNIGFAGSMMAGLLAHKHGQDGISKIDLGTEVRGVLGGTNVGDVDAARISGGIIDPKRYLLSHFDLLEKGKFSHTELDALVAFLQKTNKKLFGDITTSNLCQIAVAAKEINESVDKHFRNMVTVIPGLGTDKFYNELSRIQPESIIDKSLFDYGTNEPTQTTYTIGTNTYTFREDAAIGYFGPNGYIEGVPTTEVVALDFTLENITGTDGAYKFEDGRHNGDYVSVTEDPDSAGKAIVKLIAGGADSLLYTTSGSPFLTPPSSNDTINTMPATGYVNYPAAWASVMENTNTYTVNGTTGAPVLDETDPKWLFMLRFGYDVGNGGDADPPKLTDPKLHFFLDTDDVAKTSYYDWTNMQSLQFRFAGTSGETFDVDGDWSIELKDSSGNTYVTTFLSEGEYYYSTVLAIDLTAISGTFDKSSVAKITIYNDDSGYEVVASTDNTKAIWWAYSIESIALGGLTFFSSVDSNNTVDQIYFAIPEGEVATFAGNAISWGASEPGDSSVRIQVKTVDASDSVDDGFVLLANKSWDNAGNEYANSISGRESGSLMTTEPAGTHVEIRVILQPSSDGLSTPELYWIRLAYTVAGELKTLTWDSADGWEFDIAEKITNITEGTNLSITTTTDIGAYVYGQAGSASISINNSAESFDGSLMPLVQGQTTAKFGKINAVEIAADGNFVVADTDNHRIAKINKDTGNDEWSICGSYAENTPGQPLKIHSCYYNRAYSVLWVNFSHSVDVAKLSVQKWQMVTAGAMKLFTSDAASVIEVASNGAGVATIGIKLNSIDKSFLEANPVVSIKVDEATTVSSASDGKSLGATSITRANIIYRSEITNPIDVRLDESENIVIAQAVGAGSPSVSARIIKINMDDPMGNLLYVIDSASDGKVFAFGADNLGSVVEKINSTGQRELWIADEGNKRVVRMLSTGSLLWSMAAPNGYWPTCVVPTGDEFLVSYSDRFASGFIAKYSSTRAELTRYLEHGIGIPRDMRLFVNKLVISV